jgi:hypothetical protein
VSVVHRTRHRWAQRLRPLMMLPDDSPLLKYFKPLSGVLLDGVAPGLPQWMRGQHRTAGILAGAWLGFLCGSVVMLGTWWAWALAYMMVNVHTLSITLITLRELERTEFIRRVVMSFTTYITLLVALYLPAVWVATGFVQVTTLEVVAGSNVLKPGDALVMTGRWLQPERYRRNDLVLYHMDRLGQVGFFGDRYVPGVDRIAAFPGETVNIESGVIRVTSLDGTVSPFTPLRPLAADVTTTIYLQEGHVAIPPSMANFVSNVPGWESMAVHNTSIVPEARIVGRVWWRIRPLSRFGPFS